MKTIKVLVKEPGKPGEFRVIENTMKALQAIVGGYIESFPIRGSITSVMLVNEEGMNLALEPQRFKNVAIYGTAVMVGVSGSQFTDVGKSAIAQAISAGWISLEEAQKA